MVKEKHQSVPDLGRKLNMLRSSIYLLQKLTENDNQYYKDWNCGMRLKKVGGENPLRYYSRH
jgi:hypothetical protein